MKLLKNVVIFILLIAIIQLSTYYINDGFFMWIIIIIVGVFLINLALRNSLSFKKYFISAYNISTAKNKQTKEIDIPINLLFEKIIELVKKSDLKLADVDKNKFEILATTNINPSSWGENIYISLKSKNDKTIMTVNSTTLFQRISWGKNKQNFNSLIKKIDDSLII